MRDARASTLRSWPGRVLVPRIRRQAAVLLEVCDFCVSDAVAAVFEAAADAETIDKDVRP